MIILAILVILESGNRQRIFSPLAYVSIERSFREVQNASVFKWKETNVLNVKITRVNT